VAAETIPGVRRVEDHLRLGKQLPPAV